MRAGSWAALGVLFVAVSCIFPPFLLGALVCFIGMVVAMHWPKQQPEPINPVVKSDFAGEFQLPATAPNSILQQIQIGSPVVIRHVRRPTGPGRHIDKMVVFYGRAEIGDVPEPFQTRYMETYKYDMAATFHGRVVMVHNEGLKTILAVSCDRTDSGKHAPIERKSVGVPR